MCAHVDAVTIERSIISGGSGAVHILAIRASCVTSVSDTSWTAKSSRYLTRSITTRTQPARRHIMRHATSCGTPHQASSDHLELLLKRLLGAEK